MKMTVADSTSPTFSLAQIVKTGVIAALIASIINAIIFSLADRAKVWDGIIIPIADQEVELVPIVSATIFGIFGGTVVFAGLNQYTDNPVRNFQIIAGTVLVVSFVQPPLIPGADAPFVLVQETMHIVAGGTPILLFSRLGKNSKSP